MFSPLENGQPTVSESGVTDETQSEAYVQDAMNLYEIGRFLEFNFLAQSCEVNDFNWYLHAILFLIQCYITGYANAIPKH